MHAAVLLKPILDWELPPRKFQIDAATKSPPPELAPKLLGPFEQNALELALQLKDAGAVEKVTAIVAGGDEALETLKKALAVRADEAILVELAQTGPDDPALTAAVLARAVERLGSSDLVLAGRQAGDWDHGQVGYLVAEHLDWPAVGLVRHAEQANGHLHVWRNGTAGAEKLAVRTPAVLTVTNHDSLVLRMSSVLDLMAANKKSIERWTAADLGLDAAGVAAARGLAFDAVWVPEVESHCEYVEGEDAAEVAAALVGRLVELKLLGGVA
jgi:electron transfer flavoprotein beta subunit